MSRPAGDQHHQQPLPALFLPLFGLPFFRPPLPPPLPLPFLPPPLALFLHLLRHNVPSAPASSGLSIHSSASASSRPTGRIMSIETLIGDQQNPERGQQPVADEANGTAHCCSSATIACVLPRLQISTSGSEQRPIAVHFDGRQSTLRPSREIPANRHSLYHTEAIASSGAGKVLRKLSKGANKKRDGHEGRRGGGGEEERKQRRKGRGTHKVCFGLTPEEKAQIRETEASGGEGAVGFGCPRCGKVFSYEYYRDKHLKYTRCVDTGNRRFPCPLCPRSFEKRDRLRIHVLHVHERYRPHACSLCPKAFSQSSSLNKHLRTHSGERPYQCPHCEKAFTASSILRTHIRQHSGEKPFKCADCGKSFASHAAHDSHVRRTHQQ